MNDDIDVTSGTRKMAFQFRNARGDAITIGKDGRCECDCSIMCPLGKTGMAARCTVDELRRNLHSAEAPPRYQIGNEVKEVPD